MTRFSIVVKHRTTVDWFGITSITLEKDFTIRAELGHYEVLRFDTLEEAERALALVRHDLKRSSGYTSKITKAY